jgi:uncharacterized membrane protein (UPF0127 family)
MFAQRAQPELPLEKLTIETKEGKRLFRVEVAHTKEQQTTGLMGRAKLTPDRGMLFDLGTERTVHMSMLNTPFSLDILFIKSDGKIASIVPNTRPYSTYHISSGTKVRAALELIAGAQLGIMPGDKVYHSVFGDTE